MKQINLQNKLNIAGKFRILAYKTGTKQLLRASDWQHNLVVKNANRGVNLILKQLAGNTTYSLEITKVQLGNNYTAPTNGDTALGNLVIDNIMLANRTEISAGVELFEFFGSDAQITAGTYKEITLCCGTQLFARALITPNWTKSLGEDTTIQYTITLTN